MSFKINEKVVCIARFENTGNQPNVNDMVVINGLETEDDILYLIIDGYKYDTDGSEQAFIATKFRKLDYQFAEDLLSRICKQVADEDIEVMFE